MKLPNDYVVVPQYTVVIPMEEYNFLRDEYSRQNNSLAIVREWLTTEYLAAASKGYGPSTATTSIQNLAILIGLELPDVDFLRREDKV